MSRQTQPIASRSDQRSRPPLPLQVWGATDKGLQREGNEDSIYPESGAEFFTPSPEMVARKGHLMVVADGMGGTRAGSEASRWAIRIAVERYYDMPERDVGTNLRTAVEVANNSLYQYLQSTSASEGGCTMTAAVIHRNLLYLTNVGDSRAYLIRAGKIRQLTHDHSLTQQKVDQGMITPEQAATDTSRHVITRSMGRKPEVRVDLFPPVPLNDGDVVLVCSDGLTDMLSDDEIMGLAVGTQPKRAVRRLIESANKQGGIDNISVVVCQIGGHGAAKPVAARSGSRERTGGVWSSPAVRVVLLAALGVAVYYALTTLGWLGSNGSSANVTALPTATVMPTSAVATPTATAVMATPTLTPSPQPEVGSSSRPTSTPFPSPTPTATPRVTPTQTVSTLQLLVPENGLSYQNPVLFSWLGALATGQQYRLVLRHESGYQDVYLLLASSIRVDLPPDRPGSWMWYVQILAGDQVRAQSGTWSFWFVPMKTQPTSSGGTTPTPTLPPR